MSNMKSVAITGLGLEIPGVSGIHELLDALESPIRPAEFVPEQKLGRRGMRYKDHATKLALCAAKAAMVDAQLPTVAAEQLEPEACGVVVSTNLVNLETVCQTTETIRSSGTNNTSAMNLPNASSNVTAASLAIAFGLKAINLTLCNGATSGLDALDVASNAIRAGRADRMLVVGVETVNSVVTRLMTESSSNEHNPSPEPWLFDGAGAMMLESAEVAASRDAFVYGFLTGYGYDPRPAIKYSVLATTTDTIALDLWLVPSQASNSFSEIMELSLDLWRETPQPEVIDLGASIGESYGALGVLQCIVACLWLKSKRRSHALATSGGCWGDGSASLVIRASL